MFSELSGRLGKSYYVNFLGGLGSNEFHIKWRFGTHGSWNNQNPGGGLELPAKQTALPIQPILTDFLLNGPNWQCCLDGSSKTAPRILIFSIALWLLKIHFMWNPLVTSKLRGRFFQIFVAVSVYLVFWLCLRFSHSELF